ncbi:MAG: dihydrodipicolinate synthase family protein [Clostridiaceae bacterium]
MKKPLFFTPIVTAFDQERKLDVKGNKNVIDHVVNAGVDGIVVMGSTGEFFSMPDSQKRELIELAVSHTNHRAQVYVGTGCMSMQDTIDLSNFALEKGADGVMIVSPYYFKLSKESLIHYYKNVASKVKGNIFIYNYPDLTGADIDAEVMLEILKTEKNVIGYKDTVKEMGHTRDLIKVVNKEYPDFMIFSGYDDNLAHNVLSGGAGTIGGLSNLYPEIFVAWRDALIKKDYDVISLCQKKVNRLTEFFTIGNPFISMIKYAMKLRGIEIDDYCTEPFLQANEKEIKGIKAIMQDVEAFS